MAVELKKGDDFTCVHCRGTFTSVRDDDEAFEETKKLFGTNPKASPEDHARVCDDCFKVLMRAMN